VDALALSASIFDFDFYHLPQTRTPYEKFSYLASHEATPLGHERPAADWRPPVGHLRGIFALNLL